MSKPDSKSNLDWSRRHEPEVRDAIVAEYFDMCMAMVKRKIKRLSTVVDRAGIESAALLGLLQAIDGFKPEKGFLFKTYAVHRIRGAMIDACRDQDHMPRLGRQRVTKQKLAESRLAAELGRKPTYDEVLHEADLTTDDVLHDKKHNVSLQTLRGRIEAEKKRAHDPASSFLQSDAFRDFTRGIDIEGQTILYLYFYREATMSLIGKALGLSESRVSQIMANLLRRYRELGQERLLG
jgi:RNA polymerase sigma factor for flagellar operon FliA